MTNKRTLALAPLFALCIGAHADDKVTVVTTQGEKTYAMDNVERIDLSDDKSVKVVCVDGNGTTYAFDEVLKIVISADESAISTPETAVASRLTLTVSTDGNRLTVNGWDSNETVALDVYSMAGSSMLHEQTWNGQSVDISALAHGVYVVKAGTHTAKFRK